MHKLKTLALATATAGLIGLVPFSAFAADGDTSRQLSEARQEGSIWTTFALNRHLNPFTIDVDVENGSAKLTGSVETAVERDLAEQLALGIEGVTKADNQLKVDPNVESQVSSNPTMAQRFDNGNLTLSGDAQSQAAKDLAGSLASNTDGVRKGDNQIRVSGDATAAAKTQNAADDAGQAISDVWITSKVKSSFIYSRNLDGLDISVTTKDGQVSLGGSVSSSAQKQLAVETARNIRGVRGVDADAMKVAG